MAGIVEHLSLILSQNCRFLFRVRILVEIHSKHDREIRRRHTSHIFRCRTSWHLTRRRCTARSNTQLWGVSRSRKRREAFLPPRGARSGAQTADARALRLADRQIDGRWNSEEKQHETTTHDQTRAKPVSLPPALPTSACQLPLPLPSPLSRGGRSARQVRAPPRGAGRATLEGGNGGSIRLNLSDNCFQNFHICKDGDSLVARDKAGKRRGAAPHGGARREVSGPGRKRAQ